MAVPFGDKRCLVIRTSFPAKSFDNEQQDGQVIKMDFLESVMYATLFVGLGWFTGRMIHNFVEFALEYIKKHDRDRHE